MAIVDGKYATYMHRLGNPGSVAKVDDKNLRLGDRGPTPLTDPPPYTKTSIGKKAAI